MIDDRNAQSNSTKVRIPKYKTGTESFNSKNLGYFTSKYFRFSYPYSTSHASFEKTLTRPVWPVLIPQYLM